METIKEEKKADLELLKLTIESREFKIKTLIEENDYWRGEAKKLKEENEELKAIIEHYKKFEEGKERLEGMLKDIGEITSIKDGPITYRKDSTGKWVADGEPPYVLC